MPSHYPTPPDPPKITKPIVKPKKTFFDEQDTSAAAGKAAKKINPKTGMAEGWGGGAPRKGSSKKKWYGTGP